MKMKNTDMLNELSTHNDLEKSLMIDSEFEKTVVSKMCGFFCQVKVMVADRKNHSIRLG